MKIICKTCGKEFELFYVDGYAYKLAKSDKSLRANPYGANVYFCSYTCYRAEQRKRWQELQKEEPKEEPKEVPEFTWEWFQNTPGRSRPYRTTPSVPTLPPGEWIPATVAKNKYRVNPANRAFYCYYTKVKCGNTVYVRLEDILRQTGEVDYILPLTYDEFTRGKRPQSSVQKVRAIPRIGTWMTAKAFLEVTELTPQQLNPSKYCYYTRINYNNRVMYNLDDWLIQCERQPKWANKNPMNKVPIGELGNLSRPKKDKTKEEGEK